MEIKDINKIKELAELVLNNNSYPENNKNYKLNWFYLGIIISQKKFKIKLNL